MEKGTFDLKGLCDWAIAKAVSHAETKTSLPLGELLTPIASNLVKQHLPASLEIDPMMMSFGKIVIAGMEQQKLRTKQAEEARAKEQENVR
jgi:hypothetical protein